MRNFMCLHTVTVDKKLHSTLDVDGRAGRTDGRLSGRLTARKNGWTDVLDDFSSL